MKKIPVILDTDICDDIDDLYNRMYCIMNPQIELKAVTIVYSDVLKKCRFVSKIFRLMGVTDIPIGIGRPISPSRLCKGQFNPTFEKNEGLTCYANFVKPEDPENSLTYPTAQEVLKKALDETEEKVNIVCIGSLSNIGELLSTYPTPQYNINMISIMGGEVEKQMAEHNINCDPEAAQIVLGYGLPVFLGTFHESRQISFPEEDLKKYFPNPDTNIIHNIFRECHKLWWGKEPHIYDLAPIFYLTHPELFETVDCRVNVELEGKYTRGYTVPDFNAEEKNVKYSKSIKHSEIIRLAMEIYNNENYFSKNK